MRVSRVALVLMLCAGAAALAQQAPVAGDAALGSQPYDRFEEDSFCAECHIDIAAQHAQAMMSQSYTHAWDEIEYFELALPHSEKEPKVAGIRAGCNGCHAPLAFLAGDIPPPRPPVNLPGSARESDRSPPRPERDRSGRSETPAG